MTASQEKARKDSVTFVSKLFFCGLYFVQGAILAYVSNFQKPYLNESGISRDSIALLTSTMILPFIAKIFFGLVSDRFSFLGLGHRRPYMLMGLAIGGACFAALTQVQPQENFPLFFTLMVSATFGMALFDTCADGFAIDVNRNASGQDSAGAIQSFMMAGKALGYIVLSGAFGWAVGQAGYPAVFATITVVITVVFIWVAVFAKETTTEADETHRGTQEKKTPADQKKSGNAFTSFFREMGWAGAVFAAYAIVYSIFSFGIDGLITLFLHSELKIATTTIGAYGSARGVGAVIGAIAAGAASVRLGIRTTAFASIFILAAVMATLLLIHDTSSALVIGALWGAAWAFQETVFVTLAMRFATQRLAATAFALLMIFSNFGTAIGEGLATSLSGSIGFKAVFLSFAAANLLVLPLLLIVFKMRESLLDAPHMLERQSAGKTEKS